jgi:tRNA pseudouridine32 synthase/23S rRNA pseudouridine746 synthase
MDKSPNPNNNLENSNLPKRFQRKIQVEESLHGLKLFEFLANSITPRLSKATWKKCIQSGGVWLKSSNKKLRVKRVTSLVKKGDIFEIFFDPKVLEGLKNSTLKSEESSSLTPKMLYHQNQISCWFKPINLVTQDTPYGDNESLFQYVKGKITPTHLLHRLDRETEGLVLFAHTKDQAAKCNLLFSDRKIAKIYFAFVQGKEQIQPQNINYAIEGKEAHTEIAPMSTVEYNILYQLFPETKEFHGTWVKLKPTTGRKHQLRIHMQYIKRALLFDPKYSRTHSKGQRLYLLAYGLECEELGIKLNYFDFLESK